MERRAILSSDLSDHLHRYWLYRAWGPDTERTICWVMLNPSLADDREDDPTVRRCLSFSDRLGFQGMQIINLFSIVTPYPKAIQSFEEPLTDGARVLAETVLQGAELIMAAWGANPMASQSPLYTQLVSRAARYGDVVCLGQTKSGAPKHPLYLAKETEVRPWQPSL